MAKQPSVPSFIGSPRLRAFGTAVGLTLAEVIVVLALIMIVALLLMPVMRGIYVTRNGSVCVSNLRQIGIALMLYQGDHQGYFPDHLGPNPANPPWGDPYLNWMGHLAPYLNDTSLDWSRPISHVFHCPSSPFPYNKAANYRSEQGPTYNEASYGLNFLFTTDWGKLQNKPNADNRHLPIQRVQDPLNFIIIAETPLQETLPRLMPVTLYPGEYANLSRRHRAGSHVLYSTGRVEWVYPPDILPGGKRYRQGFWNPNEQ